MGIRLSVIILLLLLTGSVNAQQDTSRIYTWQGRQVRYLKIEKGKTLYSISKQYGVAQDTLISYNPGLENGLKSGMVLRIPLPPPEKKTGNRKDQNSEKKATSKEEKAGARKITDEKEKTPEIPAEENFKCKELDGEERKKELKVLLFLPFYISPEGNLNPKSHIGLDFYSGAKVAMDSLAKIGILAKVHVFDTRNDTTAVMEALRKPECRDANLIIGPLYSSGFKPVAEFARKNNICAISPFSQSDAILQSFENVVKLTPDQETLLENLCKTLIEKRPDANFILLRNANEKDKAMANHMAAVMKKLCTRKNFREITLKSAAALADSLDPVKDNMVFFPSTVQVQVIDFVSRLSTAKEGKRITLVGLQEWNNYENIDYDHLNNLHFTYGSFYYPDYESESMKRFRSVFRSENKTEPGQYAVQGYDVLFQFTTLASIYGKNFYKCLENWPPRCGLGTCYQFVRSGKKNGAENHAIRIISLEDFVGVPAFK